MILITVCKMKDETLDDFISDCCKIDPTDYKECQDRVAKIVC